jgi:phosphoribosylamine--glycine ligase
MGQLDDRTLLVRNLFVMPIEFVVRRYLTGSLWRMVKQSGPQGVATAYGVDLGSALGSESLREHARFHTPICTPTTKSDLGHDLPLPLHELGSVIDAFVKEHNIDNRRHRSSGSDLMAKVHTAIIQLFERGEAVAAETGLVLVDTKYEIGLTQDGEIILADEVHTPDSSRYWIGVPDGGSPQQLSKEFLREELMLLGIIVNDDLTTGGAERLRQVGPELARRVGERYQELEARFVATGVDSLVRNEAMGAVRSSTPWAPAVPWPLPEDLFAQAIAPATDVRSMLIVGNGGRDHTIMNRFATLPGLSNVACLPGGRAWRARQQPVANWTPRSPESAARSASQEGFDLVIVGPEVPIAEGMAEAMAAAGVPCLAPGPLGAAIEASKVHCKQALEAAGIPTARWTQLTMTELRTKGIPPDLPCVLKFDGLASGKGVFIIRNKQDWSEAIEQCVANADDWMNTARALRCPSATAAAGEPVFLIEECLEGEEYSLFALCNGTDYRLLPVARDYKRRDDGQSGPNTGGMGAVAPLSLQEPLLKQFRLAIEGLLAHQVSKGEPYRGFLFGGFMVDSSGRAKVLEFNCRLGDPETQVILPGLGDDFLLEAVRTAQGKGFYWPQRSGQFFAHDGLARVYIVGASPEYPQSSAPHRRLHRLEGEDTTPSNPQCTLVPSAIEPDGRSCGGRAFGILAKAKSITAARKAAYAEMSMYLLGDTKPHYRNDIAAELEAQT